MTSKSMTLLSELPYQGGPSDYLYARVRSRRAELDRGGLLRRSTSKSAHQALQEEYRWVYRQAGPRLRQQLLPVFEYFELRRLIVALRYLVAGERKTVTSRLSSSLLHPRVSRLVETAEQGVVAITRLEQLLADEYPFFSGLTGNYLRQGPGGVEQQLVGGYLEKSVQWTKSAAVAEWMVFLLDMRNLQAVQKHLYWQVPFAPPLLSGGTLDPRLLLKVWRQGEQKLLQRLAQKYTRQGFPPSGRGLEDYLQQWLAGKLRQMGRAPLSLWLVIDYLWRSQVASREHVEQLFLNTPERLVDGQGAQE